MKKVILSTVYLIMTPLFITFCIFFYSFLSFEKQNIGQFLHVNSSVAFAALPGMENSFKGDIIDQKDIRIEILRQFLKRYSSSLEPYAPDIVSIADRYGIDFRLLPAIAMQESNLCKKAPKDTFNCWGFGIYGKKVTAFESYPEAIETVTKTLVRDYISLGLETPEQIMKKYTPSNKGEWAQSVNHFMDQLVIK